MTEYLNKRLLFLPPGVRKGKEREPKCEDFICYQSKPLGQGAFGEVFKVRHKVSNKDFAIKVIKKRKIVERRMLAQLRREIRIMYSLRHPNIISLYSHFEDSDNFYLILEFAPGGQLYTRLKKFKTMPEAVAAQYMRETCLAVQYLHSRIPAIIHRDIKPENILISSDDSIKLGDFGWSNFLDDERDTYCGTLEYLAPEMISRSGHGVSLDIWSLGVLLYELLAGYSPFKGKSQLDLFEKIRRAKPVFPKAFPLLAKDLVKKMLKVDPEQRLTAEQVLEHSWIMSHAPLRPTADLVTVKVELPTVPEEGDVDFYESNYIIVSAPKTQESQNTVKQENSEKNVERIMKELQIKNEELRKMTEKVEKTREESQKIEQRLNNMRKEYTELIICNDKIECCKKKISELRHRNNLVHNRYISKLAELKLIKKRKKLSERKLFKHRNDLRILHMKLSITQKSLTYLTKLNCFELLKKKLDDLSSAVILINKSFKLKKYIPLARQQLKSFNAEEDLKTEIEKFIPEFKKVFNSKSKSVKILSIKLKDVKKASLLQSQIIKTLSLSQKQPFFCSAKS